MAQRKPGARPAAAPPRPAAQIVTPPKARYNMDVGTLSGLAEMGGGMTGGQGGGKMDMGAAMRMAMGGGGNGQPLHDLHLRLGSVLSPTGAPKADHFFLPAANMGPSVPLITPERAPVEGAPPDFERPRGRLLIFWGCGAHAGAGQPVIIDFAKIAQGQVPPDLFTTRVPSDRGPSASNSRSYGEWPNGKSGRMPQGGSVIGEHRIAGTYSPEIKFTLQQDYMAPLRVRATPAADGSIGLVWQSVPTATGYYAWAMGAKVSGRRGNNDVGDIIWWSSASSREFGGALWEWLSPSVVDRLVTEGVVMPPSQQSCSIPAEVKQAAGEQMFSTMIAYGPEANFVYPPRPQTGPWNQEWIARVRFRSITSWVPGMPDMSERGGRGGQNGDDQKKKCKRSIFGAITGIGC
ncbi:hypothetical protein [Sphingomonas sp.]|uniref:hypothetical protein n=1 Tax=Sphingomonas sp. TaxID=28214 RepID=UPI001D5FB78A|nr:hypothetical protein [Sphingomonas sp.]MBX9796690.1 hypothetical protein [Sphingomonas sp.]